jgi:hypothetical protein
MISGNWRDGVCLARSSITSMVLPMMRPRIEETRLHSKNATSYQMF